MSLAMELFSQIQNWFHTGYNVMLEKYQSNILEIYYKIRYALLLKHLDRMSQRHAPRFIYYLP